MNVPPNILDTVFQLARAGLAEVAKDTRNTPATIAQAASHLEAWRADCERQAQPVSPEQARIRKLEQLAALQAELRHDGHEAPGAIP